MIIRDNTESQPLTGTLSYTFLGRNGEAVSEAEPVLREHSLSLYINGKYAAGIVCLREHLAELVLGHLLAQGYIRSSDEVVSLNITADGRIAQVELLHSCKAEAEYVDSVRSGAGVCPPEKVTPIPWKKEWIFALADRLAEGMPLHEQTWATHSAFIAKEGRLLFGCEDIGRHNAIDKVLGYALRTGIDPKGCYLYSSGRIPTDMVSKAIRAGIPLLSSKASPTEEGVRLAKEYGLTLVCAARRDRMKLFSGQLSTD